MSNRTITKFFRFVIPLSFAVMYSASCNGVTYGDGGRVDLDIVNSPFDKPVVLARIESAEITESSGLAVSKCQPDVFWTHNDSGDGPFIFAFAPSGKHLGTWRVKGASNIDWEDIATIKDPSGNCSVYIGEIGDNERKRTGRAIYRVKEPKVSTGTASSSRKDPIETETSDVARFSYPESPQNAEALLVHPVSGDIYVITKRFSGSAEIFRIKPEFGASQPQKAEKIAEIMLPAVPQGLVTGGDISPDGKKVVVCDYYAAYEITLPERSAGFDAIWKEKPVPFDIGKREIGESVAYGTDADSVYATSEKKNSPLIRAIRRSNTSVQK